ncbi:aldo/keto reductase [Streptomyces abyssomicinicus]|uniref:aldo/keto reductase n=1 Tax=Streptomyces abyssomicinicus TaxID=574929 RepID=UPI00125001CD|nr:aldo/keto reductase [Streptomyces abyssomicinicus]
MTSQQTTPVTAETSGTWTLGDLPVRRVGFGAMRLPQTGTALVADAVPRDRGRAISVLRRAVDLGVNHIDTADFYFSPLRSANELINSALGGPYPSDLVIATKVGPRRAADGTWATSAAPGELRGQVEENLRQLGRDHLDLVYLRVMRPGPVGEHFGALAELREKGLIRHLGLSNIGPEHLDEARRIAPVVGVQNPYGLGFNAGQAGFVARCGELGIAFVPFYAIAGAAKEDGGVGGGSPEVSAIARAHDATPAQVRLAWSLAQGPNLLAIPGTGDPEHLAANVAAGALALTDAELATLNDAHRGPRGETA